MFVGLVGTVSIYLQKSILGCINYTVVTIPVVIKILCHSYVFCVHSHTEC